MNFYRTDLRETVKLAYPVLIGQLGHMMMGVVDSVMVGKIGPAPLAAASIGNGLFVLILIFGIGVSVAATPLVSIAVGAGREEESGVIFRQSLLVNMIMSFLLALAAYHGAGLIGYLNQPPEVAVQATAYMKTLALSIVPVMLFQTYKQFIEGLSVVKPAMVVTILANLVNIFGNWVFIFGHLGLPAMGLVGAGWATFLTRISMAVALTWYVSGSARFKKFDPTLHYRKFDKQMIKKILRIGVPSGLQYFFEVGAFAGSAVIIGWLGTAELAAHQIAINLASISFMFALSISGAAAIRVGNAVGRRDMRKTWDAGISAFILAGMVMGTFGIIFVSFRYLLPGLYVDDGQVINIAGSLLLIAAMFQLSDGTQAVGLGVLRGMQDTKIPMIFTFLAYWVVGLPGGYLLGFTFGLGVEGVWLALLLALSVSAVLMFTRFRIKSRMPIDY
jgi:MATE family multidrug resistance protein